MKILTTLLPLLAASAVFAQAAHPLRDEAETLYETGQYRAAGIKFAASFAEEKNAGSPYHHYIAACAWARISEPNAAFKELRTLISNFSYQDVKHLQSEPLFAALHDDPRWDELLKMIAQSVAMAEAKLEKDLIEKLHSIEDADQLYRAEVETIRDSLGATTDEYSAALRKMQEADSLNLITVREILDTRGWLGPEVIGQSGSTALFLVIQHADLATQEFYLPMLREAVELGDAHPVHLAYLEDRVRLRKGERQVYGSQIWTLPDDDTYVVAPLEDPMQVDERRVTLRLPTMASYARRFGIEWDAARYLEELPALELKYMKHMD